MGKMKNIESIPAIKNNTSWEEKTNISKKLVIALNKWVDVVYLYNRILFETKKKWSTYTCYNMDEPWKHTNRKEPVTKASYWILLLLYTVQNRQIVNTKQISGYLKVRMEIWWMTDNGYELYFGDDENMLKLIVVMVANVWIH